MPDSNTTIDSLNQDAWHRIYRHLDAKGLFETRNASRNLRDFSAYWLTPYAFQKAKAGINSGAQNVYAGASQASTYVSSATRALCSWLRPSRNRSEPEMELLAEPDLEANDRGSNFSLN